MLTNEERETIILFDKTGNECKIFSADRTVINKLDKLYRCVKTEKIEGEVGKTYLTDKKNISFRKDASFVPVGNVKPKRIMSADHIDKLQAARRAKQVESKV